MGLFLLPVEGALATTYQPAGANQVPDVRTSAASAYSLRRLRSSCALRRRGVRRGGAPLALEGGIISRAPNCFVGRNVQRRTQGKSNSNGHSRPRRHQGRAGPSLDPALIAVATLMHDPARLV